MQNAIKTANNHSVPSSRNIPLEWLRILSMLMIILLHSIDHSGVLENLTPGTALYYWEEFLYAMVQVCVNCFVLISGYFLVTSKFQPGKLITLWVEVVFYGFFIKLIVMIGGAQHSPCHRSSPAFCRC